MILIHILLAYPDENYENEIFQLVSQEIGVAVNYANSENGKKLLQKLGIEAPAIAFAMLGVMVNGTK